jgi:gliding motility-associated-like protein
VRVWTWFSGSYQANFDICVGTPPPPQPFDEPCNAILLEVSQDGQCSYQQFNNVNATSTTGVSNPTCSYYQGGDVWFKLEVPCSGSVIINTNTGTITDGGMAIYSGTCDNLTQIACDDDGSENGLMPKIVANNLTPGDTIWVRFWEYGNDNQGTFSICATIPPPPPPAADCATALPFCTSTTPTTVPNITDQPSLGGSGPYGCLYTIPNPTYYYLQIQNPGDISIQISQTSTTGTGLDVDFIVWGPFASLDAACLGIDATMIVDCSYSINAVEVADIPNAQVGEFYLFLVTNYSNQPGTITYQQIGGTGLSNCAVVCDITATNSSPVCASGSLDLYSTTIPSATYEWSGPYCFESTDQNPTAVSAPPTPGTYVYTVIATDPNGTRCVDTTLVTVVAAPDLGDDQEIDICVNADVNLTTLYNTTDLTTEWTIDDVEVTNPSSVSTPGLYQLIAVNTFGCADTANVQIDLSDLSITAEHTQDLCLQSGVILATAAGGDDPYTYYISSDPGNGNATGEFAVNTPAQYTITVVDEQLCEAQTAVDVTFVPNISVDAGPDVSIFSAETVQLNATVNTTAASVLWTPASGLSATNVLNPVASPEVTTTYTIEVTNAQGCIATDEITITVVPLCMNLRNAFSPNGDGINDMFEVYNSFGCLNKVVLHVYNRYGSKVFESKDYRNNWDGTYKGKPVPDGTYYAVVDYYLTTGKVITRKTDVTIIR